MPQSYFLRNRLLAALSAEDLDLLRPHLEPTRLEKDDTLIEPYAPIRHAWFPQSGMVSLVADAGRDRVEVGLIGCEGVAGACLALDVDRIPYLGKVQCQGEALRIRTEDLRRATDASGSLHSLLLRYVHVFLVQSASTAYAHATCTLEARLARWLLMARDRVERDDLVLTHDVLSKMLAVRRAGVTTAVHVLEGMEAIRARRGCIVIHDREKLEDLAGDSYGGSEAEYDRVIGNAPRPGSAGPAYPSASMAWR